MNKRIKIGKSYYVIPQLTDEERKLKIMIDIDRITSGLKPLTISQFLSNYNF